MARLRGRRAVAVDREPSKLRRATNVLGADDHLVLVGIGGGSLGFAWNRLGASEVTYRTAPWGAPGELRSVLDLARQDRLECHTERVGLADLPETFERLEAGDAEGWAVVVP